MPVRNLEFLRLLLSTGFPAGLTGLQNRHALPEPDSCDMMEQIDDPLQR